MRLPDGHPERRAMFFGERQGLRQRKCFRTGNGRMRQAKEGNIQPRAKIETHFDEVRINSTHRKKGGMVRHHAKASTLRKYRLTPARTRKGYAEAMQ
jgi:hypothetical protein